MSRTDKAAPTVYPTTGGGLDRMRTDLLKKAREWVSTSDARLSALMASRQRWERPFHQAGTKAIDEADKKELADKSSGDFSLVVDSTSAEQVPPTLLRAVESGFIERYLLPVAEAPSVAGSSTASSSSVRKTQWQENEIVRECLDYVRDEFGRAVRDFYMLERFLRLHLPKTEEGAPTFYVVMQHDICRAIVDSRSRLEREFYELEFYHDHRAAAVDFATGVSVEYKQGSRNAVGGKLPGESSWGSIEEKLVRRTPESQVSRDAFVAAKDTKWLFRLLSDIDQLTTEIAAVAHLLEVNFLRVVNPWDRSQEQLPAMY